MGKIGLRFHAKRNGLTEVFSATVDSGADVTNLNKDTACGLGLDPTTAKLTQMLTAGNATLVGYELHDVHLRVGRGSKKREATLKKVFVPIRIEMKNEHGETVLEPISNNDEQLIGHDFLQATNAVLDFATHELRGKGTPTTAHPKPIYRPASPRQRLMLRMVTCPIPKRKKPRR